MKNPFKRDEPVAYTPVSDMLRQMAEPAEPAPAVVEPVDNRPMVHKVQGMVSKTLTALIHQEHELVASLAEVTERLRNVRVSIEALSLSNEMLVEDMNQSDLVKGVEDIAAQMMADGDTAAAAFEEPAS